jgi:hypothetical protein
MVKKRPPLWLLILVIEERKVYGRGSGRRGGVTDGCSWWPKGLRAGGEENDNRRQEDASDATNF